VIWTVIDCQPWVWRQSRGRDRESREMVRQGRNGNEKDEEKKVGPN